MIHKVVQVVPAGGRAEIAPRTDQTGNRVPWEIVTGPRFGSLETADNGGVVYVAPTGGITEDAFRLRHAGGELAVLVHVFEPGSSTRTRTAERTIVLEVPVGVTAVVDAAALGFPRGKILAIVPPGEIGPITLAGARFAWTPREPVEALGRVVIRDYADPEPSPLWARLGFVGVATDFEDREEVFGPVPLPTGTGEHDDGRHSCVVVADGYTGKTCWTVRHESPEDLPASLGGPKRRRKRSRDS